MKRDNKIFLRFGDEIRTNNSAFGVRRLMKFRVKKLLFYFFFFISIGVPVFAGQYASDTWAQLNKYIAVQAGTLQSVWENNADITNGLVTMTVKGDGTYGAVIGLETGKSYNFLFFAKTGSTAPPGLQPNYTYYDAVPTGGNIQSGTTAYQVSVYDSTQQAPVHYDHIGINWDARRVITVPSYLNPGDSFYVYGNFADKPGGVTNFSATAVDTDTVRLTWSYPYGYWGSGSENVKAADVIAGGTYAIYRNTTGSTTTYTKIASVPGDVFAYRDTGLTPDSTYYYVIVSKDAYTGQYDTTPFEQLVSDTITPDSATPKPPIKVFFSVQGLDWNYVRHNKFIVYLTDKREKNKYFVRRTRAVITRIYMGE